MYANLKVNRKALVSLFILLVSVTFLLQFQLPSNAQANFCPGNVVSNGTFTGSVAPWTSAYGTPDWGNPGQVGMWGNMNPAIGEGLKQTLSLTPGTNYNGTISYRIVPGADKQPNGIIRIRLSSTALTQWGAGNTIYLSPLTLASATWTTVNFSFVAPAGPHILTINVENPLSANDGAMTSYGVIDNVCIQAAPPVIQGPKEVCQNQSATFTGPAASSWNWTFGDGGTSTQQTPSHAYSTPGTYPVKLCINGTTNCATTSIVVNALPPIPVITGPASSCGNQTATYSVAASAGFSYAWTAVNGTINGSSAGSSVNVTWNSSGVGVIGVTVTNKAGCSVTIRKEVIGCPPPLECCSHFAAKTDLKSLTAAGNNTYNFTPTLSVTPSGLYVRVTADIINTSVSYAPVSCGTAGPIATSIVGATNAAPFLYAITSPGGNEVMWSYGPGALVNGVDFPMQIKLPPAPGGHCIQYVTICIKYTFTTKDCRTCEVIRCYTLRRGGLIDLTEFTDVKSPS